MGGETIVVMQPYLFPYIGYFQLIQAADQFVFFDDVNFIQRGWINRNQILVNGKAHIFTLPLINASQNKKINEIDLFNPQKNKKKILDLIHHSYAKAPYYKSTIPLLEKILLNTENNMSRFIEESIQNISDYLILPTKFMRSSSIKKDDQLKGQEKIVQIVKKLNGTTYLNPIGGTALYDPSFFGKNGLTLNFLSSASEPYPQFDNLYVPRLSMIDVLMFNSKDEIQKRLGQYQLKDLTCQK